MIKARIKRKMIVEDDDEEDACPPMSSTKSVFILMCYLLVLNWPSCKAR